MVDDGGAPIIRLLIADEHPIVREGLKCRLAECSDVWVAGEASNGEQVLSRITTTDVDVVLLGVAMFGTSSLDTLRRVKLERPDIPVLVLSSHPEHHGGLRALRAGAAGYLARDHCLAELATAIRTVYEGKRYVAPSLAQKLAAEVNGERANASHNGLSDREYEVFRRLSGGKSIKAIAAELALSPKTVSTYRMRVLTKMKLRNDADLIRYALEHGIVR